MSQQNSRPVKEFKAGNCQASIWKQESTEKGKTVTRHVVKLQKQFKNDRGKWQVTDYFFPEDLPKIELVIRKAFEYVSLKESSENHADHA